MFIDPLGVTMVSEYRINEQLQNLWIFGALIVLQVVNFWNFVNFLNCKILVISQFSKLYDSENLIFVQIIELWNFVNVLI